MDTNQFMTLCDGIQALEERPVVKHSVYDEEKERILVALTPDGDTSVPFSEFKRLRTGFIYLSIIDDSKDYSSYYYILEKISSHFNDSTQQIADWSLQAWKDVIAYVKTLPEYPRTDEFANELTRVRERERANAAKRLAPLGVTLSVRDCDLVVEQLDGVYRRIEELLTEIGGENTLDLMLADIPYIKEFGRFLVPHQGNQPMPTLTELELPYGYLFYLCMKHLKDKGTNAGKEKKWTELINVLKDYAIAVYASQKFDVWHDILYPQDEVVRIVHEMIMRFNLYTLPQTSAPFSLAWCNYLFKQITRDARCEVSVRENLKMVMRIMNWALRTMGVSNCTHIKKGSKESKMLEDNSHGVEDMLIVKADNLNANFNTPNDFVNVNSVKYPIIETDDEYILLPKSLGTWSWYEAIYNIIKTNNDKSLLGDIGYMIEDFLHNKMLTHGITPHSGAYTYNGKNGEVDFVVEGKCADAIIECKKKSLSLKAQAGDDCYIWGDLSEFINSQKQCIRLENAARNYGPINLTERKTGKSVVYKWKNNCTEGFGTNDEKQRHVVKVSMTLKEYGPMQDKVVIPNIIKSLMGKKIEVSFDSFDAIHSPSDQKRISKVFENINESLAELTGYYKQMGGDRNSFFCRFYSMEQLYFMIRQAKDQDDFVKLLQGRFVSTGTENFWNEFYSMREMEDFRKVKGLVPDQHHSSTFLSPKNRRKTS